MIAELRLAAFLCGSFLAGFLLLFRLTIQGKSGLALTVISVLGAGLLIGFFLAARLAEAQAFTLLAVSTVGVAPAFAGGLCGGGLALLIIRGRSRS